MSGSSGRILIVGAGSTGSSVAYHLAPLTAKDVVLVDKAGIGAGMTSFSTAIVRTHYSNPLVARMAKESLEQLSDFSRIGESGFVREGMLTIVDDQLKPRLVENAEMLTGLGINEKIFSPEEASKEFPSINFEDASLVSYEPDSGYADPVTTANSYAGKARELGVEYIRDEVTKISGNGEKAEIVETRSGRKISFDSLVLCTNVWTNHLLENSGVSRDDLLPIKVSPHPVVMYRRPGTVSGKRAVVSDLINRDYYKPEGETLLSGGNLRSELDEVSVDPDTFNGNVPIDYISEYSERIVSRIPDMKNAKLQGAYYGMYDNTPDEHPIIDTLESIGFSNVICNVGLSGHGFKLSPSLGKMTAEFVSGRKNQDVGYFNLARFKSGTSIFKKYSGIGTVA